MLEERGVWFETFEHEPVRTSEEAAKTRPGYSLHQGAKAIILRVKQGQTKSFHMAVFPADKRFDNDKLKAALGAKDIRFASPEEIAQLTHGVEPGAIPPFGHCFELKVLADPGLFENERIVFNAGDRRFSVAMRSADYRDIEQPSIVDIAQ
jgi:prolyl-tRNA editing enzyme YbaK/EbsC (Cys-tRNA(Pro) deacylase)